MFKNGGQMGCICANVFFADTSVVATLQKTNTLPSTFTPPIIRLSSLLNRVKNGAGVISIKLSFRKEILSCCD
jgi:hypothetical protein